MRVAKGLALGGLCLLMAVAARPVLGQEQEPPPDAKLIADGKKIFAGKGMCMACHGADARGTPLAPNLTDAVWLNIDGTRKNIEGLVKAGVPKPKEHPAPMPPMGGASLKPDEIQAVAAYVWSLSHPAKPAAD